MIKFWCTFFENLGCVIAVIIALVLVQFINSIFVFKHIYVVIMYLVLYFLILGGYNKLYEFMWGLVFQKKYKTAILVCYLICWFNFPLWFKCIKMINAIRTKKNIEIIEEYFNDSYQMIQYLALSLCLHNGNTKAVQNWFYDNYINKNLPVDSYFYPIFEDLSTIDNQ